MFVLEFERELLPFNAKTPALDPLPQEPPRYASLPKFYDLSPVVYLICGFDPASKHFTYFVQLLAPNFIFSEW